MIKDLQMEKFYILCHMILQRQSTLMRQGMSQAGECWTSAKPNSDRHPLQHQELKEKAFTVLLNTKFKFIRRSLKQLLMFMSTSSIIGRDSRNCFLASQVLREKYSAFRQPRHLLKDVSQRREMSSRQKGPCWILKEQRSSSSSTIITPP